MMLMKFAWLSFHISRPACCTGVAGVRGGPWLQVMQTNSSNILCCAWHHTWLFIQQWKLLLQAETWQSDRSLPPLVGPGTRECNYQTEWVVGVGSYSFITYYTITLGSELWVMTGKINTPRYGPTLRREDIYSSDWGERNVFLSCFHFQTPRPSQHKTSLTIHSELINIWAGRGSPGLDLATGEELIVLALFSTQPSQ